MISMNVLVSGGGAAGRGVGPIGKRRKASPLMSKSPYTGAILGAVLGVLVGLAVGCEAGSSSHADAGTVSAITSTEQFRTDVLEAARPVMVDFTATWCGPCKTLAPTLEALAGEYAGRVTFVKVDVDQVPDLPRQYGIRGVPTVVLIRNGQEVQRWVGTRPAKSYRDVLDAMRL